MLAQVFLKEVCWARSYFLCTLMMFAIPVSGTTALFADDTNIFYSNVMYFRGTSLASLISLDDQVIEVVRVFQYKNVCEISVHVRNSL